MTRQTLPADPGRLRLGPIAQAVNPDLTCDLGTPIESDTMSWIVKSCAFVLLSLGCYAQTAQAPATAEELQYFRFMLMNLASPDHGQDAVKMFEDSLVPMFGLTTQEAATIHAAAQPLKPVLLQVKQAAQNPPAGGISPSASLTTLTAQREATIVSLANQILNSVRPQTAERLRMPGRIVANALKASTGGK
jgi:hypothetical protein